MKHHTSADVYMRLLSFSIGIYSALFTFMNHVVARITHSFAATHLSDLQTVYCCEKTSDKNANVYSFSLMRDTKFHCMSHAMAITAFKVGQEIVVST